MPNINYKSDISSIMSVFSFLNTSKIYWQDIAINLKVNNILALEIFNSSVISF